MTFSVVLSDKSGENYGTSSWTSAASSATTAGRLLVLMVAGLTADQGGTGYGANTLVTPVSSGMTWTKNTDLAEPHSGSINYIPFLACYSGVAPGGTITVQLDHALGVYQYRIIVAEFTNGDTGTPFGVRGSTNGVGDASAPTSITLSGTPTSTSTTFGWLVGSTSGTATSVTEGAQFTMVSEQVDSNCWHWEVDETSPANTVDWVDPVVGTTFDVNGWVAAGVEVKAASGTTIAPAAVKIQVNVPTPAVAYGATRTPTAVQIQVGVPTAVAGGPTVVAEFVKEVGSVTNTTPGTTAAFTVAAGGVPAGDVIVIGVACDNTGVDGIATTLTAADNHAATTNVYTLQTPQALSNPNAAAPTLRGSATATNNTDAAPAVSVNLPTRSAGDLLIAVAACDTTGTAMTRTQTTEWALLSEEAGGSGRLAVLARIATNDANDALSVAGPNNNDISVNIIAITAGTHGVSNVSTDIALAAAATAGSGNADPPNCNGGSAKNWLAVAMCGVDLTNAGSSISAAPTNYTTGAVLQKSASSTTSVGLGIGVRELTGVPSSADPGTFTNTSGAWIAKTLLVPPVATASDGQQGAFLVCPVTTALSAGDTITVTFGDSTTAKAVAADQWHNVNKFVPVLASSYAHTDSEFTQDVTIAPGVTPTRHGQAVLCLVAVEGGTADSFTEDADTTDGTWTTSTRYGSGTTAAGSTLNRAYKVVDHPSGSPSAQAYGTATMLGTSRDHCAAALILDVVVPATLAATAVKIQVGIPTAAVVATTTVAPAAVKIQVNVPTAVVSYGTTRTPTAVKIQVSIPTPAVSGDVVRTPTAVKIQVSIPTPAVSFSVSGLFATAVSSNGRYLVDQNNDPYFIQGNSPQLMASIIGATAMDAFFANQQSQGINSSQIHLMANERITAHSGSVNVNGDAPFSNMSTLSTPVSAYWTLVDTMFDKAEAYGVTVWASPCEHISYGPTISAMSDAQCVTFGEFIGGRYKDRPNIIWMFGNDWQSFDWFNNQAKYAKVLEGIRNAGDTHMATVWLNYTDSNSTDLIDDGGYTAWESLIDVNLAYSYTLPYYDVELAYARSPTKPVFGGEWNYEDEHNHAEFGEFNTTNETIRRSAWWTVTWGGCGQVFGQHTVWNVSDLTSGALNTQAADENALVASTLLAYSNWQDLEPDTAHALLTSGRGTHSAAKNLDPLDNDYATAAVTPDGMLAVVYLPTIRVITLDTSVMSGTPTGTWLNPVSGATQSASSPWTMPATAHSDGTHDWVLILEGTAATNAAVTEAVGTGTANQPGDTVSTPAGNPTGTGTAPNPGDTASTPAAEASGTGTAPNPGDTASTPAAEASGTGTAPNPTGTSASAGTVTATGSGTADNPTGTLSATPTTATAAGTADNATSNVSSPVVEASGSGTAEDPGVSTGGRFDVTEAVGAGTADDPTSTASTPAAEASAAGTAPNPTGTTAAAGTVTAVASGTADNPTGTISATPGTGTATGTANDPTSTVSTPVVEASGSGTAEDAQALVGAMFMAGEAVGTGTAPDPSSLAQTPTGEASAVGTAPNPGDAVSSPSGGASGVGNGTDAASTVTVGAAAATGTGSGNDTTATGTSAAGVASGAGTAPNPGTTAAVGAGAAAGSGTAPNPGDTAATPAGTATGSGTAEDAHGVSGTFAQAGEAVGVGAADNATANVVAHAIEAAGTGTADNAGSTVGTRADVAEAVGSGTATDATANVTTGTVPGAGAGAAGTPGSTVSATPGVAVGGATTDSPASAVIAHPGPAAGTGTAVDATATAISTQTINLDALPIAVWVIDPNIIRATGLGNLQVLNDLADAILQCATLALFETSAGIPDGMSPFVYAAEERPPLDECCPGMLWVRLINVYSSTTFPLPELGLEACLTAGAAAVFEVGVARCAPKADRHGAIPTSVVEAAARVQLEDMWAIRSGLLCCLRAWKHDWAADLEGVISDSVAFNDGGCLGSTTNVTMQAATCCT